MKKLLMIVFTEDMSYGVSILCSLSQKFNWTPDVFFVPNGADMETLKKKVENFNPDLIGVSFRSFERTQAFKVARVLHELNVPICAGGVHPSAMPDDVVNSGLFDFIVSGDAMGVWEELLSSSHDMLGQNKLITGKRYPDKKAYAQCFYSDTQLERMRKTKILRTLTAVNCPFSCRYCFSAKSDFFLFDVDDVVNQIIEAKEKYGVNQLLIMDDIFGMNRKWLQQFEEKIRGLDITVPNFQTRTDVFSEEVAELLVRLGTEEISFGIETVSPKLLKFIDKRNKVEDAYRAIKRCRDYGFSVKMNVMLGIPTQDEEDYSLTLDFVKEVKPDAINYFYFFPFPGSELFDYCIDNDYMPENYTIDNLLDWSSDSLSTGYNDLIYKLNGIDYDMASHYASEIKKAQGGMDLVLKKLRALDEKPWVIAGTGTSGVYFVTLLEKMSDCIWNNCLGYIDIDKEPAFNPEGNSRIKIKKYKLGSTPPVNIATPYL